MASAVKGGLKTRVSLKFLKRRMVDAPSRTTYSPESSAHTKSSALPNDFLRHASAV